MLATILIAATPPSALGVLYLLILWGDRAWEEKVDALERRMERCKAQRTGKLPDRPLRIRRRRLARLRRAGW